MIDPTLFLLVLAMVLAWDVGRRFSGRGQSVDREEFQEVVDEIESHTQALKDALTGKNQSEDLEAQVTKMQAQVEDHRKVLASHASTLIKHDQDLAKQGKNLTDMALAKVGLKGRAAT